MSRSLDMMDQKLKELHSKFHGTMVQKKIPYLITCVDRNIVEQMALYTQGRMGLAHVNRYRKAAGLYLFKSDSENKNPVTWTLDSMHIVNPAKGVTLSRAIDIVILKEDKPNWNLKVDVNDDDLPDYDQAAEIWESFGGVAGIRFGDPCHLQI